MAMILAKGKTSTTFPDSAILAMTAQVNKVLSSGLHRSSLTEPLWNQGQGCQEEQGQQDQGEGDPLEFWLAQVRYYLKDFNNLVLF